MNLFPTLKSPTGPTQNSVSSSEITENPAEQILKPSLAERLAELNSETRYYTPIGPNPSSQSSGVEIYSRPGDKYLWYTLNEEIPNKLKILIQAGADLLAVEGDDLMKVIRSMETDLKEGATTERRRKAREKKNMGALGMVGAEGYRQSYGKSEGTDKEDYNN